MDKSEVEALIMELSRKHNVPPPKVKFLPPPSKCGRPWTYKREVQETRLGTITITEAVRGAFIVNEKSGDCWIEFYGKPTKGIVNHEFKHYLQYLESVKRGEEDA